MYSPNYKDESEFLSKYKGKAFSEEDRLCIHPFIVPIQQQSNGSLCLNWPLVERVIEYIRGKINDVLYLQRSRETIHQSIGVDKPIRQVEGH